MRFSGLRVRRTLCAAALSALAAVATFQFTASTPRASASGVVISQVYGGGGNTNATFKSDFVELFNAGSTAVPLNGWSIQYASTTGTSWTATLLPANATIGPGQYYLVSFASGSTGANLPLADATGTTNLAGSGGKVVLASQATAFGAVANPTGPTVVDLVGWGTANGFEGSAAGGISGNVTSVVRKGAGCIDTDVNSSDFALLTPPAPRNSASPQTVCPTPPKLTNASASPVSGDVGASVTLSVTATPGSGTFNTVVVDLSPIGGAQNIALTNTSGNTWSLTTTVGNVVAGVKTLTFKVSDSNTLAATATTTFQVTAPVNPPTLSGASASPALGGTTENTYISVTATPGTNPIASVTADLSPLGGPNGAAMTLAGATYGISTSVGQVPAGAKSILITATDTAGLQATTTVGFTVMAGTPPTITAATSTPASAPRQTLLTLKVTAANGTFPASPVQQVKVDLTSIGGASGVAMSDDGLHGDGLAGDNIWAVDARIVDAAAFGGDVIPVVVTDGIGRTATSSITVGVTMPAGGAGGQVVISQVFGGGGNSGSTWKNDFIELYNPGATAVSLTGWSVQYASSTGSGWSTTPLSGSILPGHYYLVQEAAGTAVASPLPTPDATGTLTLSGTSGKVALVSSTAALVGAYPTSFVDLVGYGTGTTWYEGNGPTGSVSATAAALRKGNGCQDTNDNAADFDVVTAAPRNSASQGYACNGVGNGPSISAATATPASLQAGASALLTATVTPGVSPASNSITATVDLTPIGGAASVAMFDDGAHGDGAAGDNVFGLDAVVSAGTGGGSKSLTVTVQDDFGRLASRALALTVQAAYKPIHDIQGPGSTSPFVGQVVSTSGVVTARKSNGFFLQTPDADVDADINTSEGVFVFTGSTLPASAVVGNLVKVTGTVQEFATSTEPYSPKTTELSGSPVVELLSTGNPLPTPITLTAADTNPAGSIEQLERYEGMRVLVPSMTTIAPTGGTVAEADATATSNGVFFGVITGVARPFREPGLEVPLPAPTGAPANIPSFDANPERIRVDSDALGQPKLDVTSGVVLEGVQGPLDYDYKSRTYTIDLDTPASQTSPNWSAVPVRAATADEFTVASANLERFFDTVDDAGTSDVVLTAAALAKRLDKASMAIRNVMRMPDIIGIEEMENLTNLQTLAAKINADALAAGQGAPNYQAYLVEGNDIGGIDVGLLVNQNRVTVNDVTQFGKDATYINPNTGQPEMLNDRPSLVLHATVHAPGHYPYPVTVIVNHLRSLNGVDDVADTRVRVKRAKQAEYLASLIQGFQANGDRVISVGDYNAFQFNDGYVDSIGTVMGSPTPADQVAVASPDLVEPNLHDLLELATPDQRYSYSFSGNAQEIDHILVTTGANNAVQATGLEYGRMNADFPESLRGDGTRPERLSDHDPVVAYISLAADTTAPVMVLPLSVNVEGNALGGATVPFPATANDDLDGPITPVCAPAAGSLFPVGATTVSCTATDLSGNTQHAQFVVTVADTSKPVMSLPADIEVMGTSPAGAPVSFTATGADIVSGLITAVCAPESGSVFAFGHTTVACTATDAAGNQSSGTFDVHVYDYTPPVVAVPPTQTREATGPDGVAVSFTATAQDNINGAVSVTCTPGSGSTFPLGSTLVTCSSQDAQGNSASANFAVVVVDSSGPTVVVPDGVTANAVIEAGTAVTYSASATDSVDGPVAVTCAPASGSFFAVGETPVACAAFDNRGNQGAASFIVTVRPVCQPGSFRANPEDAVCTLAPAGFYVSGIGATAAVACPVGSFSPVPGASACTPAGLGYFVPNTGSAAQTACAPGTFADVVGSVSCKLAPAGMFAAGEGSAAATACPAGNYSPLAGAAACTPAPAGSFVSGSGAVEAHQCPPGSLSSQPGATACTLAPAGWYVNGGGATEAHRCEPGSYSAFAGATSCSLAELGHFVGTAGATMSDECAPGSYSGVLGAAACTLASAGSFVSGGGATEAQQCQPGNYSPFAGATSCTPAELGHFVPTAGASMSDECPAGSYSGVLGAASCVLAPAGSFVAGGGATEAHECPAGNFSPFAGAIACTPASAGWFVSGTGSKEAHQCPEGNFSPYAGAIACTPAPAGWFVSGTGQKEAHECPPGNFSSVPGSATCTPAPAGFFVSGSGATAAMPCPAGTYSGMQGGTVCTEAPPGSAVSGSGSTEAQRCQAGTFAPFAGATSCTPAPLGHFVSSPGASMADACPAGTYSGILGAIACTPAPVGSFVPNVGADSAQECPAGNFSPYTGAISCTPAPIGSYVSNTGAGAAQECPAGNFSPYTGAISCTPAPIGSYVSNTGAGAAQQCPAGNYSSTPGATACTPAERGRFVSAAGASMSDACPAGSYSGILGAIACTPAPIGSFVPNAGADSAQQCPVGNFSPYPGAASCTPAPIGSYVSNTGAGAAQQCPVGNFSPYPGAASCTPAPIGSYVSNTGAGSAQQCPPGSFSSVPGAASCTPAPAGFYVPTAGASAAIACPTGTTSVVGAVSCSDTVPPVITVPATITAPATSTAGAVVTYTVSATDVVSGSVAVTCVPASGSTFPVGTTTVVCSARDAAGNAASASFSVTVQDVATPGEMRGEGITHDAAARYHFEFLARESARSADRATLHLTVNPVAKGARNAEFESTGVTMMVFSDDPTIRPGRSAAPQVDTVDFTGVGRWNGIAGYRFRVTATDQGEPGRHRETFAVTIWAPNGTVVASTSGVLDSGNVQSVRIRH